MDDKYWPRQFHEMAEDPTPVTLLNEPIREAIELRPGQASASLYALLVGLRNQAQALLERMETRGVCVRQDSQREVIREAYAASRRLVKALEATLSLEGLE